MNINFIKSSGNTIAVVESDAVIITNEKDAVELLMNCRYQGADAIIIQEHNVVPGFFDLSTRIAGDVLQKFSTYGSRLAIVGNFSKYDSKSLRDFIYESNKAGRINFVSTQDEAIKALS